jgi:acyl-CoA thioester hydrolase
MTATFRTSRRVEFVDTDMAGIAHFSNFFRWMEAAEVDFLHARGLSVKLPWEGTLIGFPRVSAACEYLRPVRFEDVLDIDVAVERVGTKSVSYAFAFRHQGEAVAHGKVTTVCCRVREDGGIESVAIPTSLRERLLAPA